MSSVDTPDEDARIEEVSTNDEFRERITRYGLEVRAETLESLVRPSIRLEIQKSASDSLPERSTHFGGAPDLPPDCARPQWDAAPLTFIAQFDLNEMAGLTPLPLPGTRLLSIFYEAVIDDQNSMALPTSPVDRAYHALRQKSGLLRRDATLRISR